MTGEKSPLWFSAFIALLLLLPLPFGANRPWASDLMSVLCGLLLVLMLLDKTAQTRTPSPKAPRKRLFFAIGGFSLVVFWTFFQTASWSPTEWAHPLWQESAAFFSTPVHSAISVDLGTFAESLLRLVSYAACFILAFVGGRAPQAAMTLVRALAFAGGLYALYGLVAYSLGADSVLWYKKWAYGGFLTSTFINKNSYAVYAGLGLLCALVSATERFKKKNVHALGEHKGSRLMAFLTALDLKDYTFLLSPLLLLAALALTGSRAGVLSVFFGTVVFYTAIVFHKKRHSQAWLWFFGLGLGAFLALVALGGHALLARLDLSALSADTQTRLAAYRLEGIAIGDNPWLGFGLGAFEAGFRLYRDASLQPWFHHAHNDYLEMIFDLGLPAALLLFLVIGTLISLSFSAIRHRKRDISFAALSLGASALLATHACVDFSFHIPAIAATYAALLGLGAAQSWSSRE